MVSEEDATRRAIFAENDVNTIAKNDDQEEHKSQHEDNNSTISSPLAPLMEEVRTTMSGECVYVGAMGINALTWM